MTSAFVASTGLTLLTCDQNEELLNLKTCDIDALGKKWQPMRGELYRNDLVVVGEGIC